MRVTDEQVIEAASKVADKEGMSRVSLRNVADRLGIRTPSLYNHITSGEDMLRQVAYRGIEDMYGRMSEACADKCGEDALKAVAVAYFHFMTEHPGIYETMQWSMWHTDGRTEELVEKYKALVRSIISPNGLKTHETEDVVALITGFLHGYASLELSKVLSDRESAEKQLLGAIDILLSGIKSKYKR